MATARTTRDWKDTTTVVRLLCDVVSKGGNLLLNIGPDARGRVPEAAQEDDSRRRKWMRSTRSDLRHDGEPVHTLPWGRATQKPGTLYLMVFDWPTGRAVARAHEGRS
jgi:alpha-L-fucosidase